jgi:hypothetical protein
MTRRSIPILLALLALIAAGVVWLARVVAIEDTPAPAPVAVAPAPLSPADAPPAPPIDPPSADTPLPAGTTLVPIETSAAERQAIEEDRDGVDMTATWVVEGRVVLPPGTPADEEVRVLAAVGNSRRPKIHSRSDLSSDGSFRVEFSSGAQRGQLVLEAHYLRLAIPHDISPEDLAKLAGPIVLRPELGGCLRGRLVPPRNVLDRGASLVGVQIDVQSRSSDMRDQSRWVHRDTKIGADLSFEFGGLEAGREYEVSFRPKDFVDLSSAGIRVEPGRVARVDLELQRGARVSGRILDSGRVRSARRRSPSSPSAG